MTSYKKLILNTTLTVCLLFSLFFTITFYAERYISTKKTLLASADQYMEDLLESLNTASMKVQDLAVIFQSNSDIKEYVENEQVSPYLRRMVVMYLHTTIGSLPTSNSFTAITKPSDNYVITVRELFTTNALIHNYGLPSDEIWQIIESPKKYLSTTPYTFFSTVNDKSYFTVFFPDYSSFSEPYFIFSIYDLDKLIGDTVSDSYVLISNNGTPLFHTGDISDKNLEKIISGKHVFKYNTIASTSKSCSTLGTLSCTLIVPKIKYISEISQHIIFALLSFLLLFILSIFISQKASNKTYSPIEKLLNQIGSLDTQTLENEIDSISSAITLLAKRNNALSNMIEHNRDELREKFINDLLQGYLTNEQAAFGIKSHLANTDVLPVAIVLIGMNQTLMESTIENDVDVTSFNLVIRTLLGNEFGEEKFFHFAILSPSNYCAIISCKDIESLKTRLRKLLLTIESDLGFDMYSSISNTISSWEELPDVYHSTYFSHTNLKLQEISKTVYSREDIDMPILYSYEVDNDIFTHCLRHEKDKLEKSLDFLVQENFSTTTDFIKRHAQMSVLIYALCMRILATINLDSKDVFGKDYNIYLELKLCQNADDFRKLLSFMFGNITDFIERSQSLSEQRYCDQLLNFIHENYSHDISLQGLAENMNMSQSYVSRLFKKLTNYNFKDYVAKVRIEQATKLLLEYPDKTVQEISSLVGFNTAKSFSAMFQKIVGMTPSEYRNLQQKR